MMLRPCFKCGRIATGAKINLSSYPKEAVYWDEDYYVCEICFDSLMDWMKNSAKPKVKDIWDLW